MQGNKEETRKGILAAVGRLLSKGGFRSIGVNRVAREAGVDKVLIYRYFGGLPALLDAFAKESRYWPGFDELSDYAASSGAREPKHVAAAMLIGFVRALRARPVTQEILRWELHERNQLTDELAKAREHEGLRILAHFAPGTDDADVAAITSLAVAGATYLVLRSKTADHYNGIDLRSEEGWKRIESALGWLAERMPVENPPATARRS